MTDCHPRRINCLVISFDLRLKCDFVGKIRKNTDNFICNSKLYSKSREPSNYGETTKLTSSRSSFTTNDCGANSYCLCLMPMT